MKRLIVLGPVPLLLALLAGCEPRPTTVPTPDDAVETSTPTARSPAPTCEDATNRMIAAALEATRTPDERAEIEEKTTRRRAQILGMCAESPDPQAVIGCVFAREGKEAMEECYANAGRSGR
ncbi:MAG: hypothetical protein U0414_23780 [Polyangiaceae bacterium]